MGEINNEKVIKIPKKYKELAEIVGIILCDGSINVCNAKKGYGTYQVRITGDSKKDKDYFIKFLKPLVDELFGINSKIAFTRDGKHAIILYIHGKRVINFLSTIGLKDGNKLKNQVRFPNWIWKKKEYIKSCLRGLIDTDGSIYELLPHWPGLFQLSFENFCLPLLKDVRRAFLKLDFNPSKIFGSKTPHGNRVAITRKIEIHKFYKEICFHNKRHLERYSPVVQRPN